MSNSEQSTKQVQQDKRLFGFEVPRLWTRPLRELTEETSLGFEVIDFAESILKVTLYPWQKWLLIHGLELRVDGTYRFKQIIVLVARQNGKSLLAAVLAAWWLFVDCERNTDRLAPPNFKILGTAQNVDTAEDVWKTVKAWCDPDTDPNDDDVVVPALQEYVQKVDLTNGKYSIVRNNKAHYEIRAASRKGGRGKSAARVLMDELREQLNWLAWNSVQQTKKAIYNNQLWGFSNAGDGKSVVLLHQRNNILKIIRSWRLLVEKGKMSVDEFAQSHDMSVALFEWSAKPKRPLTDVKQVLQANPSIGWNPELTVDVVMSDKDNMPEEDYRTEVLCEWVDALVSPYLNTEMFSKLADPDSEIAEGSPIWASIDTSADRAYTSIAVAGFRLDGVPHLEVVASRAGMLWAFSLLEQLRENWGVTHVAIQGRGVPAIDFIEPLEREGFTVFKVEGSGLGAATGRFRDRVRDSGFVHLGQPLVTTAVAGGVTKYLNEIQIWDRKASVPDIAPLVAMSYALFALETVHPEDENDSVYSDSRGLLVI